MTEFKNADMNTAFMFGMGFGVLLTAVPLMMLGGLIMKHNLEHEAIESKVAEYDAQTGLFKYKILD
jgi:hypothetical protein